MAASVIRTTFAQPDAKHVQAQFDEVTRMLERTHPKVAKMLHDARADIVGVFPNPVALLRLAGAVLVEQHDEWEASIRRYLSEGSMRQLDAFDAALRTPDACTLTGVIPVPELTAA